MAVYPVLIYVQERGKIFHGEVCLSVFNILNVTRAPEKAQTGTYPSNPIVNGFRVTSQLSTHG